MPDPANPYQRVAREASRVVLAILAVKLLFLVLDPTPRFFLWDSVTYLLGGMDGSLPRDRSMLYSVLIGIIAVPARSLHALVIAQSLAGAISAFLLFFNLRALLGVRYWLALIATLIFAADPSQLWYERMVMAEAFGSLAWMAFVTLVLLYCRNGRIILLPLVALAGILAVSFRLNPTLTVIAVGALLPVWRWIFVRPRTRDVDAPREPFVLKSFAAHLGLAIVSTALLHTGYKQMIGHLLHTPPGYIGVEGLFHMGFVAPLIEPQHFDGTGCPPDILQRFTRPLHDPREREGQLWGSDGLWPAMQKACPDPEAAAAKVAERAIHDHPLALFLMSFPTAAQYFDDGEAAWRMNSDIGRKGMMPLELIDPVRDYFFIDAGPIPWTDSITLLMFQNSRWWLTLCFFILPVLAWSIMLGSARNAGDAPRRGLALLAFWLFFSQLFFSHIICFRYLHPFPPMVIMLATAMVDRHALRRLREVESGTHATPAPG